MNHKLAISASLFLCIGVGCAYSQQPQDVIPAPHAAVELTINKKVYGRRESVRFKAILKNIDPRGFYISKSFYEAFGSAGFSVYGRQLSGKKGGFNCGRGIGDRIRATPESRSPEEILREDFLQLRPGGFVGYEETYQPCVVSNPGEYEIWVEYVTGDWSQGLVRPLVVNRERVLDGTYKSRPVKFWIR